MAPATPFPFACPLRPAYHRLRMLLRLPAVALLCALPVSGQTAPDHRPLASLLDFSRPAAPDGLPTGWSARTGTAALEVLDGERTLRITRTATSPGKFTPLIAKLPADIPGKHLTLSGEIRVEGVQGGAALWLRADSADGETTAFASNADARISGTAAWRAFSVTIDNLPAARNLVFGMMLEGTGTAWFRHVQLLADGKPAADTPVTPPVLTVVERDTEFDHGSGIHLASLSDAQVDNLAVLAEVWGFLKYHHAAVTSGTRNWDAELFRILPKVLAATTASERNTLLLAWIDGLGPLPACSPCATLPADALVKPDLPWLADTHRFGQPLAARLNEIYIHRGSGPQFYIDRAPAGNPVFLHESSAARMPFPDAGYQLLTLFRWWNILQWWYPDRSQLPDLHATLRAYIRPMALATDRQAFTLEAFRLIGEAHDSHANLWNSLDQRPPRGACRLDAQLRFIDGKLVVWDARATRPELQPGDVLRSLGHRQVEDLIAELLPVFTGSNLPARYRDIARYITRGDCGPVDLDILRKGTAATVHVTRTSTTTIPSTQDRPGETAQRLSPDVVYIKLSSFHAADVPSYLKFADSARALVLDLRNYPSEFAPFALGGHLVSTPTSFASISRIDLTNPGAFLPAAREVIPPLPPYHSVRLAILVDETSQSQAEFTAMAFRTVPGALVVGSQTAGADGNMSNVPLPFGMRSAISGLGIYTVDGKPTQQVGIARDIEAAPTVSGIAAGRDEVLEAALRALLGDAVSAAEIQRMARREPSPTASLH